MTEKYNAFISYAWRDNEPIDHGGKGWVSTFVNRLRPLLNRKLPREIARHGIWLDYEQMRGNDNISDKIRAKLEVSHLLVPIISNSYLDSPWCKQELQIFIEKHDADSGRIFPVWMEPVENIPNELESLLKYCFWFEDDKKRLCTRWFPDIDPTDREYGYLQQSMAQDMAVHLKDIVAAEEETPPSEQAEPPAHQMQESNGQHTVLVNGGEDDKDLVNQVAACLCNQHQISTVVPVSLLSNSDKLKSSEITHDLREKLKLCSAFLIVYRRGPAHQLQGYIREYLKSKTRRTKDSPPIKINICYPANDGPPPGIFLPEAELHSCESDCVADCTNKFVKGLL